ncbi:MAG: hypothetical protein GY808_17375, partial [Gammaproteobacteria bacterium]|nr:hypothetical protein [Gammaproteobacteria bacterium]
MINSEAADYWSKVHDTLEHHHFNNITIFDNLSDKETSRFLNKSNIIDCSLGDKIISQGSNDRTVFIILEGTVELRNGDHVTEVKSSGDVIGEVA